MNTWLFGAAVILLATVTAAMIRVLRGPGHADEAGPHGVVEFGEVILIHG